MKSSFRYSLGTLFVVVTLACFLAWYVSLVLRDINNTLEYTRRKEREAMERLKLKQSSAMPTSSAPAPNPPKP